MGIVVRQSIKTTIVTLFGAVLGAIIVLASTYLLPVQYYGFIKNITNQAQIPRRTNKEKNTCRVQFFNTHFNLFYFFYCLHLFT